MNKTVKIIADAIRRTFGNTSSRNTAQTTTRRHRSPRSRRLTFSEKLRRIWLRFLVWLKKADKKLLYAAGGALVVVIALPIILVSVLGGGENVAADAEEIRTPQAEQAAYEAAPSEEVSAIAVRAYVDGNAVEESDEENF